MLNPKLPDPSPARATKRPQEQPTLTVPTGAPRPYSLLWLRALLWLAWLALVLFLASHHVFWRDEVRAFSIALQGENVGEMLRGLHGEGHPAIWYLLLRGAHALAGVREVLPAVALAIGAAATALLAFRAPFRPAALALILFGGLALFEYVVSARNYGLSMLLLFTIAALYSRHRDRGVLIGLLLALLCNSNVPANFLAAGLLGFWLIELVSEEGLRWTRKHSLFAANAAIAAAGAAVCFLTIYPTVHDAAVTPHPGGISIAAVAQALVSPATSFPDLGIPDWLPGPANALLVTALTIAALGGLARRPGALLAGLAVLLVFQLFFQLVYPGGYRHQGLVLMFLVTLYWLVGEGRGGTWPAAWSPASWLAAASRVGAIGFAGLLAAQVPEAISKLAAARVGVPNSRIAEVADTLKGQGLAHSIVIADPDVLIEPLPYYSDNPTYLLREQRFGKVVRFTRNARLDLRLDDVLDAAAMLARRSGRPVAIILRHRLDPAAPPRIVPEPYVGSLSMDPAQVRRFLASTRLLASFEPALTDESYDLYLLDPPPDPALPTR